MLFYNKGFFSVGNIYPLNMTCFDCQIPMLSTFFVLPTLSSDTFVWTTITFSPWHLHLSLQLPSKLMFLCSQRSTQVALGTQVSISLHVPITHFGAPTAFPPCEVSCPRHSLPASAAQCGARLQGASPEMSQWAACQAETAQQQQGQSCPVLESRPPWLWPVGSLFFRLFEHWFL